MHAKSSEFSSETSGKENIYQNTRFQRWSMHTSCQPYRNKKYVSVVVLSLNIKASYDHISLLVCADCRETKDS
jgi:hypothetical protein